MRSTLEQLGDRAMPGAERAAHGSWVARSDLGATGRANSCWVVPDEPFDVDARIDEVERWYEGRGLRPLFQVYEGSDEVAAVLTERRYAPIDGALVMVAQEPTFGSSETVRITTTPTPPYGLGELTGSEERLAESMRTALDQRFVSAYAADELVCSCILTLDGKWIGISNLRTSVHHRRRGIGSAVMRQLVAVGSDLGGEFFWLQVSPANDPAIAMYRNAGFEIQHRYSYVGRSS